MAWSRARWNLLIGVALMTPLSVLTLGLLLNEYRRPVFAPENAWLWFGLVALIPLGFGVAGLGLRRGIGCGYFIWSQTVLSLLVSSIYIGWYRRELDYLRMGPDPDALSQGPPTATLWGFLILVLAWLLIGLLPLGIRQVVRRFRRG